MSIIELIWNFIVVDRALRGFFILIHIIIVSSTWGLVTISVSRGSIFGSSYPISVTRSPLVMIISSSTICRLHIIFSSRGQSTITSRIWLYSIISSIHSRLYSTITRRHSTISRRNPIIISSGSNPISRRYSSIWICCRISIISNTLSQSRSRWSSWII